jgi:transcriptional regulator with XRE-family HTH domain
MSNYRVKTKLIDKRNQLNLLQEDIAEVLDIDQTQYSRRELGKTKIKLEEWKAIAKFMKCDIGEIYESDENVVIINNENANGEYSGSVNNFNQDKMVIDTLNRFIAKIEEENTTLKTENITLKTENTSLKEEIAFLREQVGKTSP